MSAARFRLAAVFVAILGACAKGPGAVGGSEAVAAGAAEPSNACVKDLGPDDLAPILRRSGVIVKAVANNAQACRFEDGDGAAVVIGLRFGDEVAPFWKLAVDASGDAMVPLADVGDAALRKPDGSEVIARKGMLSCQAEVVGAHDGAGGSALAAKLAGLCTKVFAARRA